MKSLKKEYSLDIEVKYLWELVSDSLVIEPGRKAAKETQNEGGKNE